MSRVDDAFRRAAGAPAEIGSRPGPGPRAVEDYPTEVGRGSVPAPAARPEMSATPIAAPRTAAASSVHHLTRLAPTVEGKVVIDTDTSAASIEEYRRLAASLHLLQTQRGIQVLMVSSALPRDGKTLTSTNLALTLSESYKRRVLLIDADLRRPSLHDVFRIPNTLGLADGLRGDGPVSLPFIEVSANLTILPAGAPDSSPMAGLTSERMRSVVRDASSRFDWVILDTPPVGLISDGNLLARLADGVLLVIGAGSTPFAAVQRAIGEFGRERILGVVLNRVNDEIGTNDYYKYYGSRSDRMRR